MNESLSGKERSFSDADDVTAPPALSAYIRLLSSSWSFSLLDGHFDIDKASILIQRPTISPFVLINRTATREASAEKTKEKGERRRQKKRNKKLKLEIMKTDKK